MPGARITPQLVRSRIDELLLTDQDFIAFCQDNFPATQKRFSDGMDRVARINLLLQLHKPREVATALAKQFPNIWNNKNGEQAPPAFRAQKDNAPRDSAQPLAKSERLLSNLLPIVNYSQQLYIAPALYTTRKEVVGRAAERGRRVPRDWILRGKNLLSFRDLSQSPWNLVCDSNAMETHDTADWAKSDSQDRCHEFIELLNLSLTEMLGPSVAYHREKRCYYFTARPDENGVISSRKISYRGHKKQTEREIIKIYTYGPNKEYKYYQHTAFNGHFTQCFGNWFLVINPTYLYTADGRNVYRYHHDRLTGLKRLQNNDAVHGEVNMWSQYLQDIASRNLFSRTSQFLEFSSLIDCELSVGIDDASWKKRESSDDAAPLLEHAGVSL